MKVSKQFHWEASHRLPWHEGSCSNLHGHSYQMDVELEGEADARGMVVDFKAIKQAMKPLVERWDHAILVAESDTALLDVAESLESKSFAFPYDTTSENLAAFAADYLKENHRVLLREHAIRRIRVRVCETATCFAEVTREVSSRSDEPNVRVAGADGAGGFS